MSGFILSQEQLAQLLPGNPYLDHWYHVAKFPTAPDILIEKCPPLKTIQGEKISIIDYTKIVTENYTLYYECMAKNESWTDWYKKQKEIFEEIK